MRALVLLLLTAACNQVFGVEQTGAYPDADLRPDRDGDGTADVMDECIAPDVDGMRDDDGDGIPASEDACPYTAGGSDGDGDGIADECDPFPAVAGDRHLCTMSFGRVEVNSALWRPRTGEQTFAVADGYMIGFAGDMTPTSVIAVERIAPRTGTITLDIGWSALPEDDGGYAFRVYINAGTERSPTDLSCAFVNGAPGFAVGMLIGDSETPISPPNVGPMADPMAPHIARVQIQPGKAGVNVLCAGGYKDASTGTSEFVFTTAHLDGELGEQGFAVSKGAAILYNLITYHTPEQPALL